MPAAAHCRGLLTSDPALTRSAAQTLGQMGLRLFSAQALENTAVLLGERGDLPGARAAYRDAVQTYRDLDAAWDVMRADSRLRKFGIRRGAEGRRKRPTSGSESLTPAEEKIARLVAVGRSNPDIATELFLSRRTVETHMSHILAKLGAHSRVEIAWQAARHAPSPAGNA
jgi:DNA-binding NarL/FixJ family response regulator